MSDLVAFVRARLDEDEEAARDVAEVYLMPSPDRNGAEIFMRRCRWHERFTPSRILQDVAARRRTLDRHRPVEEVINDVAYVECRNCADNYVGGHADWPCADLLNLASVWSAHPDYDPTWRVD